MSNESPTAPEPAPLDEQTLVTIAEGLATEPVPAPVAARIRHRLLERIAEAETRHLTVPAGEQHWQPFQPGVMIKVLHEADGVMSYLLRLAAGAALPAHRHPIDEECVVLEGSLRIGADLVVTAGGFHLARRDAPHARITTDQGALIFLRGATPHPADIV